MSLLFMQNASQAQSQKKEDTLVYYNGKNFSLEGTAFSSTLKANRYHRLPDKFEHKVRGIVWELSKCPAGMSIRFLTNSTQIQVKWSVINSSIAHRNHMAATGIKGLDLYFKNGNKWQYVNTARPNGNIFDELLIENMDDTQKEFRLYLPLYIELTDIQIGIDGKSMISKARETSGKPIVFYGTSITQGGCASRPGMAHTNVISRKSGVECLNFGFRGNGKMEPEIGEIINEIEAKIYVIECLPNMTTKQVVERTRHLVEIIRKKQEKTPIVFVENLMYEKSYLDHVSNEKIKDRNSALKREYLNMKNDGFRNIYFVDGKNALGNDHEATVDGIHLTDLGFLRYADFLIQYLNDNELL